MESKNKRTIEVKAPEFKIGASVTHKYVPFRGHVNDIRYTVSSNDYEYFVIFGLMSTERAWFMEDEIKAGDGEENTFNELQRQ